MNYRGNYPKTKTEWWKLVDEFWPDLTEILNRFMGRNDELPTMIKNRDPRLASYFQSAWLNAPDSPHIHDIPGWDLLCDLCSERHVFNKYYKGGNKDV